MSKIEYRLERFGTLVVIHITKADRNRFEFTTSSGFVIRCHQWGTQLCFHFLDIGDFGDDSRHWRYCEWCEEYVKKVKQALDEYNAQEEKKDVPRWYIDDEVAVKNKKRCMKIASIEEWFGWVLTYNNKYRVEDLRDPTEKELELYFRKK